MQANDLISAAERLRSARRVVVFSGAGMSAESGIPTFRDALTGLWSRFDAERLATPEAFERDPELVWGWYEWRRMKMLRAQPNPGHRALVDLSRHVAQLAVITQNVDDLHERAGSTPVLHLHGRLNEPRCSRCACAYPIGDQIPDEPQDGRRLAPPRCARCDGAIRPGVVWFGEALPLDEFERAQDAAMQCDVWMTVGTSGLVYPAAELPLRAQRAGAWLLQINPQMTGLDDHYDTCIAGTAAATLPALITALQDGARISG